MDKSEGAAERVSLAAVPDDLLPFLRAVWDLARHRVAQDAQRQSGVAPSADAGTTLGPHPVGGPPRGGAGVNG